MTSDDRAAAFQAEAIHGQDRASRGPVVVSQTARRGRAAVGEGFYRLWLDIERYGFKGCPIPVLADWPQSNTELCRSFGIPDGRQLVSVFRIGRPRGVPSLVHARQPVDELIAV